VERPDVRRFLEQALEDVEELPEEIRKALLELAERPGGHRPDEIRRVFLKLADG
jgi:hypothetical protein